MRLLYLSLHATPEGQAGWADIDEVVRLLEAKGWDVSLRQPSYVGGRPPGALRRLLETLWMQVVAIPTLLRHDALYVRSHTLAFPLSALARILGVPVVQECNGPYEDLFAAWPALVPFKRPLVWLSRVQYRWADGLITVTDGLSEWLRGETSKVVATIGNGANTDVFRPLEGAQEVKSYKYAVFFGSLAPWQGIDTMLAATRSPRWPEGVRLVVAGDGMLRGEVERAVEGSVVEYLGCLPQDEVAVVVAGSIGSVIVKDSPVHAETGLSPLKLYESLAAGAPIIVSDLPGLREPVSQHECGIVVPAGDADALAAAVARLAGDEQLRRELGSRGREAALRHYSWESVTDRTAAVIEQAIARRKHAGSTGRER